MRSQLTETYPWSWYTDEATLCIERERIHPGFANLSIGPVWPESPERTAGFQPKVAEALT